MASLSLSLTSERALAGVQTVPSFGTVLVFGLLSWHIEISARGPKQL